MKRTVAWLVVLFLVAGCGSTPGPVAREVTAAAGAVVLGSATPTMAPLSTPGEPLPKPTELPSASPVVEISPSPSETVSTAPATPTRATLTPEPSRTWTSTPEPSPSPSMTATATPVAVVATLAKVVEASAGDPGAEAWFSGAVLIARDGVPVFSQAYGLADRSAGLANRVDTRFNLASMGKMFTATAVMQMAERGLLSLEDRIIDHLPDYPNRAVAEQVTIHQLLTHTSGMGDVFTDEYTAMPKDRLRTVEAWLPLFVDTPLLFEPGTEVTYSNAGYVVLGLIIERISGQSYYDYVSDNVFLPSGMADTDAYELDAGVPDLAIGYTLEGTASGEGAKDPDAPADMPNTEILPVKGFPAGGSYSTVEDLLRFSNALMRHELLSPASTDRLLEGKVELQEGRGYGYGFFDERMDGQRAVGHTGGFPGICDFMYLYPDLGYTVVVLSNSDTGCVPLLQAVRELPWGSVAVSESNDWGAD